MNLRFQLQKSIGDSNINAEDSDEHRLTVFVQPRLHPRVDHKYTQGDMPQTVDVHQFCITYSTRVWALCNECSLNAVPDFDYSFHTVLDRTKHAS